MARPKKVTSIEESKTEVPEIVIEQSEIKSPIADLINEENGQPIGMEKVDEVMKDAGYRKIEVQDEKVFDKEPLPSKPIELVKGDILIHGGEDLSIGQKITNFIDSRDGDIKLNDFLKSLFPLPKNGEPPVWLQQGANRTLRGTLEGMRQRGEINILNNAHMKLGECYWPDSKTGRTEHYNLNTLPIIAKK